MGRKISSIHKAKMGVGGKFYHTITTSENWEEKLYYTITINNCNKRKWKEYLYFPFTTDEDAEERFCYEITTGENGDEKLYYTTTGETGRGKLSCTT
jgi:hypothetical protein